jgi:hypothetical protein
MSDADPNGAGDADDPDRAAEAGTSAEPAGLAGPERDDGDGGRDADDEDDRVGDRFGVGIHVTDRELQFVVRVPSSIDAGWTDPESFQRLVERVVWERLDRESTLRAVASAASTGDTVTLGTVTLRPDGTVVEHTLSPPAARGVDTGSEEGRAP